jgi:hypothetical protein
VKNNLSHRKKGKHTMMFSFEFILTNMVKETG